VKSEAATQLRDNLEHYTSGQIYIGFLKRMIPLFVTILKGPPVFVSTSPEQVCGVSTIEELEMLNQ